MPIINLTITKPSADAKVGIGIVTRGDHAFVTAVSGLAAESSLKVNDIIVSINGTPVASKDDAIRLIKAAESEMVFVASRTEPFIELVKKEFAKEFNIFPHDIRENAVIVDHKSNPDDLTACLCPGCVQQYSYQLTLNPGGTVDIRDRIAGTFNRVQGNAAAGSGNASQIVSVASMADKVRQKVSRIESQLLFDRNNLKNLVALADAPNAESMGRGDGVADQLVKLKELLEGGVLSEEEFEKAKMKLLG